MKSSQKKCQQQSQKECHVRTYNTTASRCARNTIAHRLPLHLYQRRPCKPLPMHIPHASPYHRIYWKHRQQDPLPRHRPHLLHRPLHGNNLCHHWYGLCLLRQRIQLLLVPRMGTLHTCLDPHHRQPLPPRGLLTPHQHLIIALISPITLHQCLPHQHRRIPSHGPLRHTASRHRPRQRRLNNKKYHRNRHHTPNTQRRNKTIPIRARTRHSHTTLRLFHRLSRIPTKTGEMVLHHTKSLRIPHHRRSLPHLHLYRTKHLLPQNHPPPLRLALAGPPTYFASGLFPLAHPRSRTLTLSRVQGRQTCQRCVKCRVPRLAKAARLSHHHEREREGWCLGRGIWSRCPSCEIVIA